MVDRVELLVLHQFQQMRKFEGSHPSGLEHAREASDKIVDVRHMRQHVIGDGQVCCSALLHQFAREAHTEKILDDIDAACPRRPRRAGCGLNAQAGYPARFYVLQEIAVVRGDFDHLRGGIETKPRPHVGDVALGMRKPAGREGTEIRVVGGEQLLGAGVVLGLRQPAFSANQYAQGEPFFRSS